jgi:hypothetical protein
MRNPASNGFVSRASLTLLFGAAVIGGAMWASRNRTVTARRAHHDTTEKHRDETLQDSFPASDAPATRDYEIPVNVR